MKLIKETIGGRECWVCLPQEVRQGERYPFACLLQNGPESETIEQTMALLAPHFESKELAPFLLFSPVINDPNAAYTPWPGKAVFGGGGEFGGRARETVRFLTERFLPEAQSRFPLCASRERRTLLGYSLAGLCALYALYETDAFGGFGSLSGSLWYEGWLPFMKEHRPKNGSARVYLSLGEKEEHSRNRVLATVGARTRGAYELLKEQLAGGEVTYAEGLGGHFYDIPGRHARALDWLMKE